MTDNEIIKALECCKDCKCKECPCYKNIEGEMRCTEIDEEEILRLINCQKAEIERLQHKNSELQHKILNCDSNNDDYYDNLVSNAKSEAIKEFSNELIKTLKDALYGLDIKEKTISKEEVRKRFELLLHKDIPEVIEYVKEKMVGDEK